MWESLYLWAYLYLVDIEMYLILSDRREKFYWVYIQRCMFSESFYDSHSFIIRRIPPDELFLKRLFSFSKFECHWFGKTIVFRDVVDESFHKNKFRSSPPNWMGRGLYSWLIRGTTSNRIIRSHLARKSRPYRKRVRLLFQIGEFNVSRAGT